VSLARREVLLASAAVPLAMAAPTLTLTLTAHELRILAMCATPPEAWDGREHEYTETRRVKFGSDDDLISRELKARGLLAREETPWRADIGSCLVLTTAGSRELQKVGVDV
jgi:hypothetical protein